MRQTTSIGPCSARTKSKSRNICSSSRSIPATHSDKISGTDTLRRIYLSISPIFAVAYPLMIVSQVVPAAVAQNDRVRPIRPSVTDCCQTRNTPFRLNFSVQTPSSFRCSASPPCRASCAVAKNSEKFNSCDNPASATNMPAIAASGTPTIVARDNAAPRKTRS